MKKQQKLIEPKDFLFHTYLNVRVLFVISIIFILLSLVFLIYYFASRKKYKDINRDVHYVELKPQWLYTSISFATCSIVFLLVIWFQYYKIFKFQKSKNEWIIISLFLASCAIFATDVAFILSKEPCTDPDKYLDPDGHCVCLPGLQTFSDGSCGCGLGYIRSGDSCLEGCKKDEDCPSGVCNTKTGVCCPMNTILCGDNLECCHQDNCVDDGSGGNICCGDNIRLCTDQSGNRYCCPPGTVCDPLGSGECVAVCGPKQKNTCTPEQDCFVMNGKKDSLNVFAEGLSGKTEIDCKNDSDDCSLYYCTPSTTCNFTTTPQFLPNSTTGNVSTKVFYPCYNLDELQDASGQIGIDQIDICIPKDTDGPYQSCLNDDGCKSDNCELVNIAKANYFDADKKTRIDNAIKNLNTTQGNYKGDYCGEGRIKIFTNTFSTDCTDEMNAALSCATQGAFQNSKYTYFGKTNDNQYYCNSYIECEEPNQNNIDNPYFTSYKIGNIDPIPYNLYNDNFVNATENNRTIKNIVTSCDGIDTTHTDYTWQNTCPTKIKTAPVDVWQGGTLPGDAGMCPLSLEYIQSCGDTSKGIYDSNFCNSGGQILEYDSESFKEVLPIGIIIANADPNLDLTGTDWRELNGDIVSKEEYPELYDLTEGIWGSGGTGLDISLPDLQARTIFVLSQNDSKNVEPVFSQKISLNQQFGRLEPYKHHHAMIGDMCDGTKFKAGNGSAPYYSGPNNFTSSESGVTSNDAQKAFPPYLGIRWIIKASKQYPATIPKGSIIMTYSGNQYTDSRLQDFDDDSFFLFQETTQYCDLFKGCTDQPCATIKVGERNGDPNKNFLCHTHPYKYCDKSRETIVCLFGCDSNSAKEVDGRGNYATSDTKSNNPKQTDYDVYPPFKKYSVYSTNENISNNWFKDMIFFYPSKTIPFGYEDLKIDTVHTPLLSNNTQIPETGGKMSITEHSHNTNYGSTSEGVMVYSGSDGFGKSKSDCETGDAPENKNQLDVYPPSTAFYGIVWQG